MHAEHNSLKGLLFRLESAHRLSELCVCPSALFSEREKDVSAFSSSSNKALRLLTSTPLLVVLFSPSISKCLASLCRRRSASWPQTEKEQLHFF